MDDKFAQFVRGEITEEQYLAIPITVGARVNTSWGEGKVVHINKYSRGDSSIGVELDRPLSHVCHDCQGYAKPDSGWYFIERSVEVIRDEKV